MDKLHENLCENLQNKFGGGERGNGLILAFRIVATFLDCIDS